MDVQVEVHSTGDEFIELPVVDGEDHEEIEDEELLLGNGEETCSIEDEMVLSDEKVQETNQTIPLVSKDLSLRGYQIELAKPALEGKNSIICAPTGSGKTWIAGFICQEMKQKARDSEEKPFKAAFIVCQRTLVLQQQDAMSKFLGFNWDIKAVGDSETDNIMADVVERNDMIVITAGKFLNSLKYKSRPISLHQFHVLIMDECHHTDLSHPYNEIMNLYHSCKKEKPDENLPLIVGLTASLGVGSAKEELKAEEHYINMCANLDCYAITHVRDPANREELEKYNPKPRTDQIKAVKRRANRQFFDLIAKIMKEIEGVSNICQPPDRGNQKYQNWMDEKKNLATSSQETSDDSVACEMLINLNKVLMIFNEFRIKDANQYLGMCMPNSNDCSCEMQEKICQLFDEEGRKEKIKLLENEEKLSDCPQLNELYDLLKKIYQEKPESKGILLTRTREGVKILFDFIKDQKEFSTIISPGIFVGHGGQKRTFTMTQHGQESALEHFKLGNSEPERINLLVATDVAQEGLDMPKCNFVIRYNFVSNEIGSVQSKGRARAPESEVYLIVTKGDVNETRELVNLQREHLMQETLHRIAEKSSDELKKRISKRQESNWNDNLRRRETTQARQSTVDVNLVNIHCSQCKIWLCAGTDLCKTKTMYMCVADDFEDKVNIELYNGREFETEKYIGNISCKGKGCPKNPLGQKVIFKQGSRSDGFILLSKGCIWKTDAMSRYELIKQWSKVPFTIKEEQA